MSVHKGIMGNSGRACCGIGRHHLHSVVKWKIGMLLVIIGLIWLGARVGLLDFTWLHSAFFWPLAVVLIGMWMVYRGLTKRHKPVGDNR